MNNDTISSYSTRLLLGYAESCGVSKQYIFNHTTVPATKLLLDTCWLSFKEWEQIYFIVKKELCKDDYTLGYEATMMQYKHSTRQTRILRLMPMIALKKFIPYIMRNHINKNLNCTLTENNDKILFSISPIDTIQYSKELCTYNMGSCAAIIDMRLDKETTIKETSCVMDGELCCTYEIPTSIAKADRLSCGSIAVTAEDIDAIFKETP